MPETRYMRVYEQGTGRLLESKPYIVSDAQLADEAQEKEIQNLEKILGTTWTLAQTQTALKLIIKRLIAKGIIP